MSGDVTARDRVWAAILEAGRHGRFKVSSVESRMDFDERPSTETIRRVLRAGKALGVIEHTDGSPYYSLSEGSGW